MSLGFQGCAHHTATGEEVSSREIADHVRALGLAETGRQNVWIIHPVLGSAGVSACLTDVRDGVCLLVWSPRHRSLHKPVSDDLLSAMCDPTARLPGDSPAIGSKGDPQMAFRVPTGATNDFAARVFLESANLSTAPGGFRFQHD
jgi:hypothetical protein